ncbi:UvrD-helicase domain-containing protein [Candidatus Bathyarchaeota archaeon]|nr:UvrD-helicase domain-containing protein [Candidatus Bathyarchaeota archaeon]
MNLRTAVEEILENLQEIKKQHRLKHLRKYLKFILIGFFIGRDTETKIQELTSQNQSIIQTIVTHLHDLVHVNNRIEEITDNFVILRELQERIETFKEKFSGMHSLTAELEEELRKKHELILDHTKNLIKQKENIVYQQVESILNSGTYLIHSDKQQCINSIKSFENDLTTCKQKNIFNEKFIGKQLEKLTESRQIILEYNTKFVQQRKKDYEHLWNNASLSLDDEQQTAIVTDDKHNLVVAAAGSGKTEVLTTRTAYLITRKPDTVHPQRILAIAYQRKAMEQIEQRLYKRHNIQNVNVKTFHKLGKDILEETGDYFVHTDIVNNNRKHDIISRAFKQKVKNESQYYQLFLDFVRTLHDKEINEGDEEKEENLAYARERPYFSIDNTQVNSRAEKEIMDFFLMHKLNGRAIAIRYEPDIGGFLPDFHLPEYDIFIEHWGLTKEGEVPNWFNQTTEEYKHAMEMKKQWLADHDKVLIETFAYEYDENNPYDFFEVVKSRVTTALQKMYGKNFEFTLKSYEEILDVAWQSYRTPVDDIQNFITIAKTYGLRPENIAQKLRNGNWLSKQIAFGNLVLPIFSAYEEALRESQRIDFEDMINKAIAKLEDDPNLRANLYDHILIDEYQDISAQRYKLIKKLMERNPDCKLFCVGDDWQSIMGFAGSNLNFFVNFDQYFANPAITKISTNYRSIKTIVDAGAALIKNNTSCQIQKPAQSHTPQIRPIKILKVAPTDYEYDNDVQIAEDCVDRIQHYIQNGCSPSDILVLSRCMRTKTKPRGYKFLSYVKALMDRAKESELQLAYDRVHTENEVRLLTAHRSKGLEAKVVFLLNATEDTYGFPCQIEDPAIYEPAREDYPPQNPLEEERRLFYVAITRAMEDLYIYTRESAMSKFLNEITDYTTEEPLTQMKSNNQIKEIKDPNSVEGLKEAHLKAYEIWEPEEDNELLEEYKKGISITELAKRHKRTRGAIHSRIRKLEKRGLFSRREKKQQGISS